MTQRNPSIEFVVKSREDLYLSVMLLFHNLVTDLRLSYVYREGLDRCFVFRKESSTRAKCKRTKILVAYFDTMLSTMALIKMIWFSILLMSCNQTRCQNQFT